MKYRIGLDLGIASCGASAIQLDEDGNAMRILSLHSRTFDVAEVPKTGASLAEDRRVARGLRRRLRRKTLRLEDMRKLLGYEDMSKLPQEKDVNELRVYALDNLISNRDFARVLYSIAKHRGFKSNRKNATSKDDGKLLEATKNNDRIMQEKGYRTVGELLIKEYSQTDCNGKIMYCTRNKGGDYVKNVTRLALIDEVNQLFASQQKFGNPLASDDIKEKYLEIFARQRNFDEGPGKGSKYSGTFAVGKCEYDGKDRMAKSAYTVDYANALQKINNIKILCNGEERNLTMQEKDIVKTLLTKKCDIKYKDIRKALGMDEQCIFNMISYVLPKKKGEEESQVNFDEIVKKVEDKVFVSMKNSDKIRKALDKENQTIEIIDAIANVLLKNKSEGKIANAIKQEPILSKALSQSEIEKIFELDCSKTSNLSEDVLKKILPYLEEGIGYTQALELAGYKLQHNKSRLLEGKELRERIEEITSPVVKRSVSQAIKVVNALIRKYGSPVAINIELAREMSKSFAERKNIEKDIKAKELENSKIRNELEEKLGRSVKYSDFIKYKLYEDQKGTCPYSGEVIELDRMLKDDNYVQIDHILPYSQSFDDSLSNKVLVLSRENQNKRNMTAMQYQISRGKEQEYRDRVTVMFARNTAKKEKLLKVKIDENEWKNRALNDTSYLSRFMQNLLQDFLVFEPCKGIKRNVYAVKGAMTATMRRLWGINKVREDGDTHHAVDAAIIAVTTNRAMQSISEYYQMRESLNSSDEYVDTETGEVITYNELEKRVRLGARPPYKGFVNELRIRCIEDKATMSEELAKIGYSQEEIEKANPIFVSRMPKLKAKGNMHQATYMSAKHKDEGIVTIKTALTKLKYDDKKDEIVGYYDKDSDRKLYELLLERLRANNGNAEKAFAEPVFKPTKDGRLGPQVKSVKVVTNSTSGMYIEKTKSLVANDSMIRLDIFTKNNKYYGVPIYVSHLYRGILPNKAAVKEKNETEWIEMDDSYEFLFSLHKNDLVYITHKKGIELNKSIDSAKSKLSKTKMTNSELYYYNSFDRSSCRIKIYDNHNCYEQRIGITTLQEFKKFTVDVLGNVSEVKKEKRMPLSLKK